MLKTNQKLRDKPWEFVTKALLNDLYIAVIYVP
jgi:hypothetical protein